MMMSLRWRFNRILRLLLGRRAPSAHAADAALCNYALDLAQEWGSEWMKPTQERLGKAFPRKSKADLDRLDATAREAMNAGHALVYTMAEQLGTKNVSERAWEAEFSARFPWVDGPNRKHLFSTGRYYAWKDLGLG